MDHLNATTSDRYRVFADWARGASPLYEEFALSVADDRQVLSFLASLPMPKRQPTLLFASVKYLTGVLPDYSSFREFVIAHGPLLRKLMLERSTQTNEPGRCAVILPLLSSLPQPIALLEAGAAAGLCLLPDRYAYDYDGRRLGPERAAVVLPCKTAGAVPLPHAVPHIAWRCGLDLNPLDAGDPDTVAWLTALVWPGETDRENRLRAALALAASDPPRVVRGDIREDLTPLANSAPNDATLVIFHSAVMQYLAEEDRTEVVAKISRLDAVWDLSRGARRSALYRCAPAGEWQRRKELCSCARWATRRDREPARPLAPLVGAHLSRAVSRTSPETVTTMALPHRFTSGDIVLAGELITPETPAPHPAVILLHFAASGERKFYRVYAEAFAAEGIASFIFDRRGEGESGGNARQDIFAFARDAEAAFSAIRALPEVDPSHVGLWGYSNGAWVASLAASRLAELAFLVLTGASGVSPAKAEVYRRVEDLRSRGISKPTLDAVGRTWTIVFGYISDGVWNDNWDAELSELAEQLAGDQQLAALTVPEFVRANPSLDSVPRLGGAIAHIKANMGASSPDFAFDPIAALEHVSCPVLIVNAEHDANLPMVESMPRFERLARQRPGQVRIEILAGADHQFSARGVTERNHPESLHEPSKANDFMPGYLELMGRWMAEQSRG